MQLRVRVVNRTRRRWLADARVAESRAERGRGLLGTGELRPGEGLLIRACRSVHSFGMRYALDVVFISPAGEIVKAIAGLRPGRVTRPLLRARAALELPVGAIAASGTRAGDLLEMTDIVV